MQSAPSLTARLCAAARAAHMDLDGCPKLLEDTLAGSLSGFAEDPPGAPGLDQLETYRGPGPRSNMVVRSRYVEDAVAEQAVKGPLQYVILGAGLDTFALRRPDSLSEVAVYEVDHPATQTWKRARLETIGQVEAHSTRYIPVDMERQSIVAPLTAAGLDRTVPTIFSLLGVSQYITREALAETIGHVAQLVQVRCEVVMNFIPPIDTLPQANAQALRRLIARSDENGEAWLSHYTVAEIAEVFRTQGFALHEHLAPDAVQARYFAGRTDGLAAGQVLNLVRMARI